MMHPFCKYPDGTEAVFSDIRKNDEGIETVWICFERPKVHVFDTIIFELPSYNIIEKDGNYTEEEIAMFKTVVECGAPSFFEWARNGGIQCLKKKKV